jgi:hypothetical protein
MSQNTQKTTEGSACSDVPSREPAIASKTGTMTALAEGDEVFGRLGAIVLARWWPGPGPVPVRDGWLPREDR